MNATDQMGKACKLELSCSWFLLLQERAFDFTLLWEWAFDLTLFREQAFDFMLFWVWMVGGIELPSFGGAWNEPVWADECSVWSNVKSSSIGKSELGDAVIRWTLELLMSSVRIAVGTTECLVGESS